MRTRNELERLAAAGRPLLSEADALVDAGEEEWILERILAFDRAAATVHRRRRAVLVLAGVAVLAAVSAVASIELGRGDAPSTGPPAHHHLALSGSRIQLAGYRFKTPAGFKHSAGACMPAPDANNPRPGSDGFAAAASADGGCVEAVLLIRAGAAPAGAEPVDVGGYHGWYVSPGSSAQSALYVEVPNATGDGHPAYLELYAKRLTKDQLVAVAQSGLATLPLRPTTTTG
jgi:hypothetical protein